MKGRSIIKNALSLCLSTLKTTNLLAFPKDCFLSNILVTNFHCIKLFNSLIWWLREKFPTPLPGMELQFTAK
jgi:hypothetical protein